MTTEINHNVSEAATSPSRWALSASGGVRLRKYCLEKRVQLDTAVNNKNVFL
jgi:hypothetical protein